MKTPDYESLADEAMGNWQKFESFSWHEKPSHPERWCIVYTHNRDSGLLDQSNAAQIEEMMSPYEGKTCFSESHNHWAVGYVDGYSILVRNSKGVITKAFRTWCDIKAQLDNYPILNEEHYSELEYEAAQEAIKNNCRGLEGHKDLPEDWTAHVYDWLLECEPRELENRDDQGAYPSEESIMRALVEMFPTSVFPEKLYSLMDSELEHTVPDTMEDEKTPLLYVLNDADGSYVCAECVNSEIQEYLSNPRTHSPPNVVSRETYPVGPAIKCAWCAELIHSACGSNEVTR